MLKAYNELMERVAKTEVPERLEAVVEPGDGDIVLGTLSFEEKQVWLYREDLDKRIESACSSDDHETSEALRAEVGRLLVEKRVLDSVLILEGSATYDQLLTSGWKSCVGPEWELYLKKPCDCPSCTLTRPLGGFQVPGPDGSTMINIVHGTGAESLLELLNAMSDSGGDDEEEESGGTRWTRIFSFGSSRRRSRH